MIERIQQAHARAFEIIRIARHHCQLVLERRGCDQSVRHG